MRRLLAGLAVAVGLASVAGCSTRGEIIFNTESVTVDLHLRLPEDESEVCNVNDVLPGLTVQDRTVRDGEVSCRMVGTILLDEETSTRTGIGAIMTFSGGHQFLVVPPMVVPPETDLDITMHFAGPIVAATSGGEVDGTSVRWRDAGSNNAEGLGVTARTVALPPPGLVPAGTGLALGALLLSAAVIGPGVLRKRAARASASSEGPVPLPPTLSAPRPADDEQPTGQASDPDAGARHTSAPQTRAVLPPEDPSVWASDSS